MMCEGSKGDIVFGLEIESIAVGGRGVLDSFISKLFGGLAEVRIQDSIHTALPRRGEFAVRILDNSAHVALECSVKFALFREFCAIIQAAVYFLWHKAVIGNDMKDIVCFASGCKVQASIQTYILFGTVGIRLANHEHL